MSRGYASAQSSEYLVGEKAMKELLEKRAKELFGPDTRIVTEYRVWIPEPPTRKQRERSRELEYQLLTEFNGCPIDFGYRLEMKL